MRYHANKALMGILATGLVFSLYSCKENDFKVNGNVEGGAGKTLVLEKADFYGRWIPVDSTSLSGNGDFSIEAQRPSAPEIYRLALGERYIYLPIDSTETVSVTANAADFGGDFSLSGTPQAERMAEFEKELMALDFNDVRKREEFKKKVFTKYLKDAKGGVISYYVLTKTVGDKPLYDIRDAGDMKYYAAVATSFEQFRPDDPHTRMLKQASMDAIKRQNTEKGKHRLMEAEEIKIIDIDLPDENNKSVKLSDVTGKGKRTVMIVSMMNEKESPLINKKLSEIYNRLGGDVEFYQVSLDEDLYAWRDAARNLPWTTVVDPGGNESRIVLKYNVTELPAFFIYNAAGELTDRAFSLDELNKKL